MSHNVKGKVDDVFSDAYREALDKRLASEKLKLPVLPQAASRILALTDDPDAGAMEFSQVIHQDQALAGHVLRIANSAAYGGVETIVSLQQAVARLGTRLLGEIAIAVSVQGEVFKTPGFEDEAKKFSRFSIAAGAFGKEIARLKRRNVEGQFLCGMMHNIGKPATLQTISDIQSDVRLRLAIRAALTLVEEYYHRFNSIICDKWQLPQLVRVTSEYFNIYERATEFQIESAMTYLSVKLASWCLIPGSVDEKKLAEDPVVAYLNFYPDDVQTLFRKKDRILSVVSALAL